VFELLGRRTGEEQKSCLSRLNRGKCTAVIFEIYSAWFLPQPCVRGNSCLGDSVEHFSLTQEKNPYFSYRGEKTLRIWKINGTVTHIGTGTLAIFFLLGMILLYFLSQSTFYTVLEIIRKLVQAALGA
jgi:hypothetical protein